MTDWRQPRSLEEFGDLTPAEQKALDELDSGQVTILGDGELPGPNAGSERQIRATFLRWLILDPDLKRHEKGVRIAGALIVSDGPEGGATVGLDLEGCSVNFDLGLMASRFSDMPFFRSSRFRSLFLDHSVLPGLNANRIETAGDVFLRDIKSNREIGLLGARVGANLDCSRATLQSNGGFALCADQIQTRASAFFRGTESDGEIRLPGARIGGNLDFGGAKLRNANGKALNAAGATIEGALFLRESGMVAGALDLTAARIRAISDEVSCWPTRGNLLLDRLVYEGFTGSTVNVAERLRWLGLQDPAYWGGHFWPQPWEQCAKVLREMGHGADARAVLVDKEKRQRAARRLRLRHDSAWLRFVWHGLWDWVLALTVRYGRQPLLAFAWLGGLWLIGWGLHSAAWQADAFKPNTPFVLRAPEWVLCAAEAPQGRYLPSLQKIGRGRAEEGETQLDCFLRQPEAASYPEFNSAVYSADVVFPLVEIQQQAHWVPNPETGLGLAAKMYHYAQIILGWALSLLAVAGFSGLVKSD